MQAPCMNAGEMQVDIPKGNMLYYDQAGAIPFVYDDVPKGDGFDDCFRYGDGELKSNKAARTGNPCAPPVRVCGGRALFAVPFPSNLS